MYSFVYTFILFHSKKKGVIWYTLQKAKQFNNTKVWNKLDNGYERTMKLKNKKSKVGLIQRNFNI
jgi:hypothetical protein